MNSDDYARFDATGLAELVARGEVSKDEILRAALERIRTLNPQLNAVINIYDDPVDDPHAAGPLPGVPFLLKDIGAGLAGKRTICASRFLLNTPPQSQDDELSLRFKSAGLRILGKTNLPEFGFNVTTEPGLHGATRNPFNLAHSAGGSSGGAAAAVASGMVPIAHATDGAGSIRIPAACCGLVGLKPSRGLIPQGPAHSDIYGGLVSEGVVTRTVRDTSTALAAIGGIDPGSPYAAPILRLPREKLRIGVLTSSASDVLIDNDALGAVDSAAKTLNALGHHIETVGSEFLSESWTVPRQVYKMQVCTQAASDFAGKDVPGNLETINQAAILRGRMITATEYLITMRKGHDFTRQFSAIWKQFEVLLTPALSSVAPQLGQFPTDHDDVDLHVDRMARLAPFASIFNLTGGPALSVCVGSNSRGLPLSVQLAADMGGDRQLLAVGESLHVAIRPPGKLYDATDAPFIKNVNQP